MIDGLKVTMSGEELKGKLDERIQSHARQAAHWARQLKTPRSDEGVPMPAHIVENEIERAHDQVETLTFIRDHIIGEETYRLGEYDLRFADLLPDSDLMDCGCLTRDWNPRGQEGRAQDEPGLFDDRDPEPAKT
jgi:hypothetical protein